MKAKFRLLVLISFLPIFGFSRIKMTFEPRPTSKFIAFDAISDIKVGINFLLKGMYKDDYQGRKVIYCYIGNIKFKKAK